jgi:hypothetical protein
LLYAALSKHLHKKITDDPAVTSSMKNAKAPGQFKKSDYSPKREVDMQLQIMIAISNAHTWPREL